MRDLQHVPRRRAVLAVRLDERVGIAGAQRPADHRLPHCEDLARPAVGIGLASGPLTVGLQALPEHGQARLSQNLGIGRRRTVEAVQLRGQLQIQQTGRELRRVGPARLAGPQVQLRQPLREAGDPAVGVVDVLDGPVGAAVGVLGQPRRGVVMARVAQILEGVDHLIDPCGPAGRLPIGHEAPAHVVAVREGTVDAASPVGDVGSGAPRGQGLGQEALAQPQVRRGHLKHDLGQPVGPETLHESGQLVLGVVTGACPRPGARRPDAPAVRGDHRQVAAGAQRQGHGHAVLAERTVLGRRARAGPPRPAAVGPQLHGVRHRAPHCRLQPPVPDLRRLDPPVTHVRHPARIDERPGEPSHRRGVEHLGQRLHGLAPTQGAVTAEGRESTPAELEHRSVRLPQAPRAGRIDKQSGDSTSLGAAAGRPRRASLSASSNSTMILATSCSHSARALTPEPAPTATSPR